MKIVELEKVPKNRFGHLDKNGIAIKPHEEDTAKFLLEYGFSIEVIRPSNTPKTSSPDFLVNGSIWETKSPIGGGTSTIPRQFHRASKQAAMLILDLRRIKIPANKAEQEAIARFEKAKNIKRMLLVLKTEKLLDIKK